MILKKFKQCPPPSLKFNFGKIIRKNLVASAVLLALSSSASFAQTGGIIDNSYLNENGGSFNSSNVEYSFDEINVSISGLPVAWNQILISTGSESTLNISGNTFIRTYSVEGDPSAAGTYAIHSLGKTNLLGDVDIVMTKNTEQEPQYGFNAIWANGPDAEVNIGSPGSSTKIWVLADKADTISAKEGAKVNFKSNRVELIGGIDMMDEVTLGTAASMVTLNISGNGYYWFGDEMSLHNTGINFRGQYYFGTEEINLLLKMIKEDPEMSALLADMGVELKSDQLQQQFNLSVTNGAQWTYFGHYKGKPVANGLITAYSIPKRVSSITLSDGGIINLYDENLKEIWSQQIKLDDQNSLLDHWKELGDIKHDYVRLGDLKGNGGIFRLDLNSDDRTKSDMVFIESSTTGGHHFIEPYRPQDLASVSDTNRLIFALSTAKANSVSFAEKQNIYGETLFDYELGIDHETITAENQSEIEDLVNEIYGGFEGFDINDYLNGTKWFVNRLTLKKSSAALAMTGAGYAAYDAAIEMDRRDQRLLQAVKDDASGLWIRARHGERGVSGQYTYQLNGATVGFDRNLSDINTLNIAFTYEDGDTDFESVKGNGDMKRYELAVYDTFDFGAPYIDLTGRIGMVSADYTAHNQNGSLKTTGDFDQKYAAVSAEFGYTLMDNAGVFIEPQLQVQVAYLDSYDYSSDRGMEVAVDSNVSVLSRIGLRAGKYIDTSAVTGEIYGRADVYHQFTDGQDAVFSDASHRMDETWGLNKTFASIGLGSALRINKRWGIQFDIERNLGGKTLDSWVMTGQAKYEF